jgi:hypothetical protein
MRHLSYLALVDEHDEHDEHQHHATAANRVRQRGRML